MSYNTETGMYEGYIYKATNMINMHIYIGQTMRTIEDRWLEHVRDAIYERDDYYFHKAIRKYTPDQFKVEQLEILYAETIKELKNKLNQRERYYINVYNTYNPLGYNGSQGGEGGCIRPIDYYSVDKVFICTFDSMTTAHQHTGLSIGFICGNCIGYNFGTNLGFFRYHGDPLDKYPAIYRKDGAIRINKFSLDGTIVDYYESATGIRKEYNVSQRIALRYVHNHVLIDEQYVLFLDTEDFDYNKITEPFVSKIDVYDLNGNVLQTFISQSEAGRVLHVDFSAISKCCLGKITHVKNYVFKKHPSVLSN